MHRTLLVSLLLALAFLPATGALDSMSPPIFGSAGELRAPALVAAPVAQADGLAGDFLPNVCVDDDINPEHREPAVTWGPDGWIYAIYCERATHYNPELVMCTRSRDGGLTWQSPAVRVNDTAPNATFMPAVDVMADGMLVAAWGEMKFAPDFNDEIRFSRSSDGGQTWTASRVVHPLQPTIDYLRPSILVVGERILVAYWAEVAYPNARPTVVWSDDRGVTWSAPVTVTTRQGPYDGSAPCLAYNAVRGTVGLVMPTSDEKVFFYASSDNGQSWSAGVQVNDASASSVSYPDLDCANGRDYVVWDDNRTGQTDCNIYISSSGDGVSFTPSVRVNDSFSGNQYEGHLRIDRLGNIHVCWIWNLPFQMNIDLYYSVSIDGGATWLVPCPRVNDVPYVVQPYVAWSADLLAGDTGCAYLFWNDGRATGYYDNIYFSRSFDPAGIADGGGWPGQTGRTGLPGGWGECRILQQPGPQPILALRLDAAVSDLRIDLLDAAGRHVSPLWSGPLAKGEHRLVVRAPAGSGQLPAGAYFARVASGSAREAVRVLILR